MMNDVVQFLIVVSGMLSVYLISKNDENTWKGFMIGALVQPLWLYSCVQADQWGMMLLSLWYFWFNLKGWEKFKVSQQPQRSY